MELHILACNQRRPPCASLCLYTYAISTPIILLCKNRFLHVTCNTQTIAYKLITLLSQKNNKKGVVSLCLSCRGALDFLFTQYFTEAGTAIWAFN